MGVRIPGVAIRSLQLWVPRGSYGSQGVSPHGQGRSPRFVSLEGKGNLCDRSLNAHRDTKLKLCVYTGTCSYVSNTRKESDEKFTKTSIEHSGGKIKGG